MESYGCAQVSFNLTDFHKSNLQDVFEACKKEATANGVEITGSEVIGLVPQEAILKAGQFYSTQTAEDDALIAAAVENLLLDKIHPFQADKRILEKLLAENYK